MQQGLFVTFEGVDGCGKTTQLQLATEALKATFPEKEVVSTKNPGGTALGLHLRSLLLNPPQAEEASMASDAELLLYMADRAQHIEEVVKPTLRNNGLVLCDRFGDSTLAYQGYGRGLDKTWIEELHQAVCKSFVPDVTFLFDAPVPVLLERLATSRAGYLDRIEQEGAGFLEQVREGFLTIAQHNPQRIVVLDATLSIETLHKQVVTHLQQRLQSKTAPIKG